MSFCCLNWMVTVLIDLSYAMPNVIVGKYIRSGFLRAVRHDTLGLMVGLSCTFISCSEGDHTENIKFGRCG